MRPSQQFAEAGEGAAVPAVWAGLSPREANRYLAHLRRWAGGLNIAMLVVIVLGAPILPSSTSLSILLALVPWVAITLVAHYYPLVTLVPHRHETVQSLGLLILVPSIITSVRASMTMHALDQMPWIVATVLGALLLAAGAAIVDPAVRQWRHLAFFLCIGLFYGHGAAMQANALADRSAGQIYRARVLSKHELALHAPRGGASYSFYLHLDHWGPLGASGDVEVPNSLYAHTRPGQTICARMGSGALAIRWYQLLPCSDAH